MSWDGTQGHRPNRAPIVAERCLRHDVPSLGAEDADDLVDQPGMGRVEQAVERLPMPQDADAGAGAERLGECLESVERQRSRLAPLRTRDDGLGQMRALRELLLRPGTVPTQRAGGETEADGVHPHTMTGAADLRLMCRSNLTTAGCRRRLGACVRPC